MSLLTSDPWEGIAYGATLAPRTLVPRHPAHLHRVSCVDADRPLAVRQGERSPRACPERAPLGRLWSPDPSPEQPERCLAINPLAYQFVFISGLTFGTRLLSIERLSHVMRQRLVAAAAVVTALCLVLRLQYAFGGPLSHFWTTSPRLQRLRARPIAIAQLRRLRRRLLLGQPEIWKGIEFARARTPGWLSSADTRCPYLLGRSWEPMWQLRCFLDT